MKHIGAFLAAFLLFMGVLARAAGPQDGKWIGTAPDAGDCGVLTVTLVVANNMVAGIVSGKHGSPSFNPTPIAPDGTAQVEYGPTQHFKASIRFSGDQFTGSFQSFCGVRNTIGKRAP